MTKFFFVVLMFAGHISFAAGFIGVEVFKGGSDKAGIGLSAGSLEMNTIGYYLDVKSSALGIRDSEVDYNTARFTYADQEIGVTTVVGSFTGGVTYLASQQFYFTLGAGFQSSRDMAEFYNAAGIRGNSEGKYFSEKASSNYAVMSARAAWRPSMENDFSISAGIQTGTVGFFVGVNWVNF